MSAAPRQMHINLLLAHGGFSPGAWKADAGDVPSFADIDYFIRAARIAEEGKLDAVFIPDVPALLDPETRPPHGLDPIVLFSALAAVTDRIGLIGTASTSYGEPYNIARRWASMEHISGGRMGWNVVASAHREVARNFGDEAVPSHAERYARAREAVEVVQKLWNSWEEDAFLGDRQIGRLVDPARLHEIDHEGAIFRVKGPLTVPRSPQGHPVLVQAGASDDGRALAAAIGEVIFAALPTEDVAREYRNDLRKRAQQAGRAADALRVLPGLSVIVADSQAEVNRRIEALEASVSLPEALRRMARTLEIPIEALDADAPLPFELLPPVETVTARGSYQSLVRLGRDEGLTVRQIVRRQISGGAYPTVAGTPDTVADFMEHWFLSGAADGFAVLPDIVSDGLEAFVRLVLPELRRRGLFRHDYSGATLREHLGLEKPSWAAPRPVREVAI